MHLSEGLKKYSPSLRRHRMGVGALVPDPQGEFIALK